MKERPILFSGEMVRAILDGRKMQTRRIFKKAEEYGLSYAVDCGNSAWGEEEGDFQFRCPQGQPGDLLWVRETHRPIIGQSGGLIAVDYQADPREKWERLGDQIGAPDKWKPSIHMRREYSRIRLEITNVRVERLNDISGEDAFAEGIKIPIAESSGLPLLRLTGKISPTKFSNKHPDKWDLNDYARFEYAHLWESLNGSGSWEANPWVWVIEFKILEARP